MVGGRYDITDRHHFQRCNRARFARAIIPPPPTFPVFSVSQLSYISMFLGFLMAIESILFLRWYPYTTTEERFEISPILSPFSVVCRYSHILNFTRPIVPAPIVENGGILPLSS